MQYEFLEILILNYKKFYDLSFDFLFLLYVWVKSKTQIIIIIINQGAVKKQSEKALRFIFKYESWSFFNDI